MGGSSEIRGVRRLLELFMAGRRDEDNGLYIESMARYLRERAFSSDAVEWMESKLRTTLNGSAPLGGMDRRQLTTLAQALDDELFMKQKSLGISIGEYRELRNIYLDALDTFSSYRLGGLGPSKGAF